MRPIETYMVSVSYDTNTNSCSFNRNIGLREDKRWLANTIVFVRQIAIFDTHRTILALNFLLCLHSCISNSNENNNTNGNHLHLSQGRNENIIGNNYHLDSQSVDVGLADSEGKRQP